MSEQYLRQFSLIVATSAGNGIELGALRCRFDIQRGDIQTPNSADVRVYNLSTNTANQIASPEFTQIQIQVGYGDATLALIFKGSIKQVRQGREDAKDSYVDITAADGDEAYNFATCAFTMAAGAAVPGSVVQALIANMARASLASPIGKPGAQSVTPGYISPLTSNAPPRGGTYFGLVTDELRDFAANNDCKWSMQDGTVCLIPNTGYIATTEPILITPTTGLIGVPEQTQNGLELRTLLNPALKIGQRIQLQSQSVNQFRYGLGNFVTENLYQKAVLSTAADGIYYVMRANHSATLGGTSGTPISCAFPRTPKCRKAPCSNPPSSLPTRCRGTEAGALNSYSHPGRTESPAPSGGGCATEPKPRFPIKKWPVGTAVNHTAILSGTPCVDPRAGDGGGNQLRVGASGWQPGLGRKRRKE